MAGRKFFDKQGYRIDEHITLVGLTDTKHVNTGKLFLIVCLYYFRSLSISKLDVESLCSINLSDA